MEQKEAYTSTTHEYRRQRRRYLAMLAIGALGITLPGETNQPSIANIPRDLSIVALGDSYLSGEGNAPFDPVTNIDGVNQCHRSEQAYPAIIARDLDAELRNVACSGATVEAVLSGGWNELPQVLALRNNTDLVILQINGNVIDNRGLFMACQQDSCGEDSVTYAQVQTQILQPENVQKTEELLRTILQKAPKAKVLVIGYPNPVDSLGVRIVQSTGAASRSTRDILSLTDMASSKINELNREAIKNIDSERVYYIPVSIGGPQTVYLSGDTPLHPNGVGHQALAKEIEQQLGEIYREDSSGEVH